MVEWVAAEELFKIAPKKVRQVNVLVDIGCGIKPQWFIKPKIHILCEPFEQYVKELRKKVQENPTFIILKLTWSQVLEIFPEKSVDTVFLLDVIEHLPKEEGKKLLNATEKIAKEQIMIFTPLGFMPQCHPDGKDAWGLDGGAWQEHKSGWFLEDFDHSWQIIASSDFIKSDNMGKLLEEPMGAFFAIKNLNPFEPSLPRKQSILKRLTKMIGM